MIGGFGYIVACDDDSSLVWKVIPNAKTPPHEAQREYEIMHSLSHPNIVKVYQFLTQEGRSCLQMDHGGVDLLSGTFPVQTQVYGIFIQMVSAVTYMHSRRVAHRDLKLENVLLDSSGLVRITDFGLSVVIPVGTRDPVCDTACGSRAYAAPEMWSGKYDPFKSDVWALGMVLFALWTRRLPFSDTHNNDCFGRWRALVRLQSTPTEAFERLNFFRERPPQWVCDRIDEMIRLCEDERVSFV